MEFRKCAVIGAGTMGAGIAAHMANAGADVVLLDLDGEVAARAVERQVKAGGFMLPGFAERVRTGSTRADMALLADADWIVEAVAERLEIKRALFAEIARFRKPGCVLSSNTSTIPLRDLVEGMDPVLAGDVLIAHFFNPPRQMRLLELVSGPRTDRRTVARLRRFIDVALGKSIVVCNDTPGFIANRIGCFWLAAGLGEALRLGIDVETADAVMGRPFGLPRTGVFGLYDLIGIDLMPGLIRSLQANLPADDAIQAYDAEPALVTSMLERGLTGRKGDGGFYRMGAGRGTRDVLDLSSGAYRDPRPAPVPDAEPRRLMAGTDLEGRYAWAVMSRTLAYAAALVPEIADRPDQVDEAMRLGYGWTHGPFELIDRIGAEWLSGRLAEDGQAVPSLLRAASTGGVYRVAGGAREVLLPGKRGAVHARLGPAEGVIALPALRLARRPVWSNEAASLWDLDDGVGLFAFHTKLNVFTMPLIDAVHRVVAEVPRHFDALVVGNDGPVFSAGADLKAMLALSERNDRAGLEAFLQAGLRAFEALAGAPFPVVGAVGALAVGGGCEFLLHAHRIVAHAEARIGLVEAQVGLLPGWGGVAAWLARHQAAGLDAGAAASATLRAVVQGATWPGAFSAQAAHLLRPDDRIVMNADRLIGDARAATLALRPGFRPPTVPDLNLPSRAVLDRVVDDLAPSLAPHDRVIAGALADVLSGDGRPVSMAELTARVTGCFLDLALTEPTRARMRQMIATGKPLRN
ncbi:3-hydroxyacyl-CoA dehydrogenase [Gluconacetobacter azotocaptans]|uniref:3-hydroxyacyl-CoA dehydrogenase n=1 Tax=Gluconacetobacter azotocaptans TaxID=142834 RepID=A0A7W4JW06_9PROT|nr:3-hydroxyacyl-CoA dehydrogenase/enoyl-CoA hydratase family protein [Gluconacetobacter azotocaptans]MBB2191951.1 3-hydroxyacyl-CoA dehydrogenase [Gluconacetobacter azotocaptans]